MRAKLLYSIIQSLVAFPLTPKYVSMNNVKFSLLQIAFQALGYIFIIQLFMEYFLLYDVTSRYAKVIRRILRIRERIVDVS